MNENNNIYSLKALRLILLLLMMVGGMRMWGQTVYYEQNYEDTNPIVDWTTSVGGRFTPTIYTESENHYLGGDPTQTYNNGATLTGPDLGVAAGTNFVLSFDLRLGNSNGNKPEFYIRDASGNKFFSITPQFSNGDSPWIINGETENPVTLAGTQFLNRGDFNTDESNARPWYRFKFIQNSGTTTLTITNLSTSTNVIPNKVLSVPIAAGGLGQMVYTSGKSLAKFAIDNVLCTSLFSYNSATAEADITWVGNYGRPSISGLPTIIDETGSGESITYSSTNESVARHEGGYVYLVGVGTTNIVATKGTNSTSYELTVYGTPAATTSTHTDTGDQRTSTWTINSTGTLEKGGEIYLGGITMTYGSAGETAVVVDENGTKVLKTIDDYGYSWANTEPPTAGTYYKFVTTKAGRLTLNGKFNRPRFYASDNGTPLYSSNDENITTPIVLDLAENKTYYFYAHVNRTEPYAYPHPGILNSFSYTYTFPKLEWSTSSVTVDIMEMGNHNPNAFTTALGKPTLTNNGGYAIRSEASYRNPSDGNIYHKGYHSSDSTVAVIRDWFGAGDINICGIGTTTITALDVNGNTASYTLTVTGNSVNHQIQGNTMTFIDEGVLVNSGDKQAKQAVLGSGLTIDYGFGNETQGETAIVTDYGMGAVLKMIDNNGYSHTNRQNGNTPDAYKLPWQTEAGGTFVKLTTGASGGYLIVTGNVSAERTVLYKDNNDQNLNESSRDHNNAELVGGYIGETPVRDTKIDGNTFSVSLQADSVYFLYNKRTTEDLSNNIYVPLVHSITFVPGFFAHAYEVTSLADATPSYPIQTVKGFSSPEYTIVGTKGDVGSPSISGTQITGITGGGAIRIRAQQDTNQAEYILTVAYPATAYPGKYWNFNPSGLLSTSDGLKEWPKPKGSDEDHLTASATATDADGGGWTAFWKNANEGFLRGEEWGHNAAVHGDNAFFVPETAGLVFNTVEQGFFLRNNEQDYQNIGIRKYGASFTIPQLSAGDIVELNWKHETGESGSNFTATNLTDLRGKPINETFAITESAYRSKDNHPGRYSFIATGGDVTFTLQDNGNCDILSIRIYSGPYQSTMRSINQQGNIAVPNTLIVDGVKNDGYTYNYCNQLNSTATGPAFYVLKGYRNGIDDVACVTGTNAAYTPVTYTDDNASYPAYPVTEEEKTHLYELRKHLSFNMYNQTWQSRNNSYNYGHIEGIKGWGKVTIRMNNYTNDMKYLIGYTPDYTLTIGSAPHQTYPYTWDFTNISSHAAAGAATNVFNTIHQKDGEDTVYDRYATNWTNNGNAFTLKTDNTGSTGSQYVPGTILVATDKALSSYTGATSSDYATGDELNGLGIDGQITIYPNTTTASSAKKRSPQKVAATYTGMKCETATTITLPDLHENDWIYVSASTAPTSVENDGETLSSITSGDDGADAASGVYKYKVINDGNVYLTFAASTTINKIGVTNILKPLTQIGSQAWATESRNHAIDHSLTGFFTKNDVNAYTVTLKNQETHKTTVQMNAIAEDGYVPESTGMVLRLDGTLTDANSGNQVPLFYPSATTPQTSTGLTFPTNNRMHPNINAGRWYNENGQGSDGNWYSRFILAKRYMTWKKEGTNPTIIPTQFISGEAPVFYRLHIYNDTEFATMKDENGTLLSETTTLGALNTFGANKAYLLLPTSTTARWNSSSPSPRRYIAIEGISDMEELEQLEEEEREASRGDGRIYNLNGQVVGTDEKGLPAGIYIRNGKKIMVR